MSGADEQAIFSIRQRPAPSAILLLAAIVFALTLQGAFFRNSFLALCMLVFVAAWQARRELRQVKIVEVRRTNCTAYGGIIVPALCALSIVTTLISAIANDRLVESIITVLALTVAGLSAWIAAVATSASKHFLLRGLVVAGVGVAASGFVGVVGHHEPLGRVDGELWRAASTLTYANATAAFLGLVLPIALVLAVNEPRANFWKSPSVSRVITIPVRALSRPGSTSCQLVDDSSGH